MATLTLSPAMVTCEILHNLNKGIIRSLVCFNSCIWSECLANCDATSYGLLSDQRTPRASSTSLPLLSLRCNLLLNILSSHSQRHSLYKHTDNHGQLAHNLILTISLSQKGREDRKKTRHQHIQNLHMLRSLAKPSPGLNTYTSANPIFGVVIRSHIY